ncbi:MAG: tRNA (adenosine(37)-N6)-threonylcarbamoyltransferase complex ATPase subunit type 1 TsaE [Gammaproteobacteria bacterium]|nr:tRNA (adenosine(37)-N6)-threonylcarbamoyltransferase complex ATPase subunit type 1 TsaE [Gammaproteobacteria bacterium]
MTIEFDLDSPEQQEALGARLAATAPSSCIIYLEGDLGAGKTTLSRGFIQGLGHEGKVKSPTYTLLEPYEALEKNCYHFDLYRLADPEELEYLGIRDLLDESAIFLVEWPGNGEGVMPSADLIIRITHRGEGRHLQLVGMTNKGKRMELAEKVNSNQ